MNVVTYSAFQNELEKIAFDWHKAREGFVEEGIPLSGAAIGAGLGGLRGAALGYAAGSGASLLRSKLQGEKPSLTQKVLAGSGLGFGLGGLAGLGMAAATKGKSKGMLGKMRPLFHEAPGAAKTVGKGFRPHFNKVHFVEEALPAAGAVAGTGIAMGTHKDQPANNPHVHSKGFGDRLRKSASIEEMEKEAFFREIGQAVKSIFKKKPKAVFKPSFKGHKASTNFDSTIGRHKVEQVRFDPMSQAGSRSYAPIAI